VGAGHSRHVSVSDFASVADRQDYDFLPIVMIQGNISSMPEFDDPLAKLWRYFVYQAANFRMLGERLDPLPNRLNRALGRVAAFREEKVVETGDIPQGRF
jgi:hypothetical protein